ncbi:MAG: hypothetical protein ACLVIY_09820 [Anaerobutyricum soehngenii]
MKSIKEYNRHEGVEVNTKMPEELRRVPFRNMIYVADGPSDIPAFSLVNKNQGATFAIYPHGDMEAMRQVEQMRVDGRINMYAEAELSEKEQLLICGSAIRLRNVQKEFVRENAKKYPFTHRQEHRNILHNYYLIH